MSDVTLVVMFALFVCLLVPRVCCPSPLLRTILTLPYLLVNLYTTHCNVIVGARSRSESTATKSEWLGS